MVIVLLVQLYYLDTIVRCTTTMVIVLLVQLYYLDTIHSTMYIQTSPSHRRHCHIFSVSAHGRTVGTSFKCGGPTVGQSRVVYGRAARSHRV